MKIKAQIDRMFNSDNNIKASASVNIGGNFIVRGFTVMNGKNGLFVKMPNRAYRDQNGEMQHSDTFFALNNEARNVLNNVIVAAYEQRLQQEQSLEMEEAEQIESDDLFMQ